MKNKNVKSFSKNVLTLFTGSFLAQIISVGALVILQRYFYTPEDYAPFRLFFEFVAVFSSISALRLESGIVLEREDSKALSLLRVCLKYTVVIALLGGVLFSIYFFNEKITFQEEWILLILMPIAIFANGIIQISQSFFTRSKQFIAISSSKILHSFSGSISQVLGGLNGLSFIGLIIGRIVGLLTADLNYVYSFFKKFNWSKKNKPVEKELIQKHKHFIWFTTPGIFLGNSINLVILMLFTHFYDDKFTGLTAAAIQYMGLAIMLFTSSFAQVYYNEIAKIDDPIKLRNSYTYWLKRLFLVTLVGWLTLIMIPNQWITYILGEKWEELMPVIKLISPWMAIMFLASSLSYIFIRLGKQKQIFFFDLFHLLLIIATIFTANYLNNKPLDTLCFVTVSQSIFYILALALAYYFMNKAVKQNKI